MIFERYRADYAGEYIISSTGFRNGIKIQDREWVENPIINQHISGRAAVIMSDFGRDRFDYAQLKYHNGGLRGTKRLQTYGAGVTWQHLPLSFYATTDTMTLAMIDRTNYGDSTVVYTDRAHVLEFPGRFFLVPYCPRMEDPALALYLAAFDGQREIFVLGSHVPDGLHKPEWIGQVTEIMKVYANCQYYFVGTLPETAHSWKQLPNFKQMTPREFVTYCDV